MDELNLKALEQIPIPEGLEERLSAKIDEWEREELQQKAPKAQRRSLLPKALRYTAVAASVALVFGVGSSNDEAVHSIRAHFHHAT